MCGTLIRYVDVTCENPLSTPFQDLVTLTATLRQQIEDLEGRISRLDSHKSTLDKQIEGLERQNRTLKATERREKVNSSQIKFSTSDTLPSSNWIPFALISGPFAKKRQ